MPNHITNVVVTTPEVADAMSRLVTAEEARFSIKEGDRIVDFELIVPPPDHEDYRNNGCSHDHPYPRNQAADPNPNCWYSWNPEYWGTKWNAYDADFVPIEGDRIKVQFDTAWSSPFPVLEALSKKFPDEEIEVEYADEDSGNNVGRYTLKGGEVIKDEHIANGSAEAYEVYAKVKYGMTWAEVQEQWAEFDE